MATEVRYPEWYDQFEYTRFPFEDTATLTTYDGRVLPETTFLDARFNLVDAQHGVYLSTVIVEEGKITLWLGDPTNAQIAWAEVDPASLDQRVPFTDLLGRRVGLFVTRPRALSLFRAWGIGTYEFPVQATRLAASTYIILPTTAVNGFLLDDGTIVTGHVALVGGEGVVFQVGPAQLTGPCGELLETGVDQITMHVVGDPLFKRKLCAPEEDFASPRFIQQLCFAVPGREGDPHYPDKPAEILCCQPGELGDIKISAGQNDAETSILRVRVTSEGILLETIGETI